MAKPRLASNVVSLHSRRNKLLIDGCRDLLRLAENGRLTSMLFVAELDGRSQQGIMGPWRDKPAVVVGELALMQVHMSNVTLEEREEAEECLN